MSDQPSSGKQMDNPKYLSLRWLIALVMAFCIFVPLAGSVAQEVGGWLGWVIWLAVWGVMSVGAGIVTYKFANPKLPLICGVMMGITAPRPSEAWVRQIAGEGWGKTIDFSISIILIATAMTIFSTIGKRHESGTAFK